MLSMEEITTLFKEDAIMNLLGIEIVHVEKGYAKTKLELLPKHLNSVKMTHGAVHFAMADITAALASNIYGITAVATSVSINYLRSSGEGDTLFAVAKEDALTKLTGVYRIEITNQKQELLAVAEGTVFRIGNK